MISASTLGAHGAQSGPLGPLLHRARQAFDRHAEAVLCRATGFALMANLVLTPGRFPAPVRIIGKAYTFRFWRPATFGELIDIILAMLIWPLGIAFCVLWFTRKNGAEIAHRFGRSRVRQCVDQLRIALTSGLPPPWYYVFELYRPGEIGRARAYLTRGETKHGTNRLLAKARGSSSPMVDKEAFAHFCEERQLKTLPVLFSVHDGELKGIVSAHSALPKTDLFVKPVSGCGGKGAERWDYGGRGIYRTPGCRALSGSELCARLRDMSRRQPYLVQKRVRNHPAIRDLSNGALSTIRIITCLDERNQPEIIGAVLKMAVGTNVTIDNVHAGAIAAPIDLRQGRLGEATHMGIDAKKGWIDRHPITHAPIKGRVLPMWNEVCELVRSAHAAFDDWVVVGWDVAIMAGGPRLVEGNNGPDIEMVQRPLRTAFGEGRLGELIAFHLTQSESAWRRGVILGGRERAQMEGKRSTEVCGSA